MSQANIEKRPNQDTSVAAVSGVIDVTNAVALKRAGESILSEMDSPLVIDLSGIEHSGSVGVSVLLAWMRLASAQGKEIQFLDMPDKMFDVARVSGLDEVFPLSTAASSAHSS
ncbi:MAG: STAS domain-containing protein [Pseudomonadales bacterium]|nr:STAS domain-containing protein [Pseudomonadales bacterium]